jgi:hypothetical protein
VRVQISMLDAIAAAATRHPRLARLALPGRDPIDPRGRPAARTAKAIALEAHGQALAAFHARVCAAATDLVSPKALAAIEPASWDSPETLQAVVKWLPKQPADARWAELAVVLLNIPGPATAAFHELALALYPLLAKLEPERLWARLQPISEHAARVLFALCDDDRDLAGALFDREELPALLDWFEELTVIRANAVYYGVRTVLIATGDEHIREALRTRLTTHKLHRFHRWTYEDAVKSIRARPVRRGKSR